VTVLVDTSIWSLALRRKADDLSSKERKIAQLLAELVKEGRTRLLGPVRQELLSGLREPSEFLRLRTYLRDFPDVTLDSEDYEEAANLSNQCRRAGIAGSPVDILLCAVSILRDWPIFTTDTDFIHYRRVIPLRLFTASP
jgi:predicted nucleic acid-binding protein